MYNCNFVTFDLETGDLIKKGILPPVTEIAICVMDTELNDIAEYSSLVQPYVDHSLYVPQALAVANLTIKDLETKGKPAAQVVQEANDFLVKVGKGCKKSILIGHNIDKFDIPIVAKFFEDFKKDISKVVETNFTIDTMWWGRIALPHLSSFTLSNCIAECGIDNSQAHRALHDTRANKELAKKWLLQLRGKGLSSQPFQEEKKTRATFQFQIKRK